MPNLNDSEFSSLLRQSQSLPMRGDLPEPDLSEFDVDDNDSDDSDD
jgi:hypothetical protein